MKRQGLISKSLILIILPLILFIIALLIGRYPISIGEVFRILVGWLNPDWVADIPSISRNLVLQIRMPRALAALLVGASMSITGTYFQGMFRNPLVDSNILGVTAGAGFGAALALMLFGHSWFVQLFAFIFGLCAVLITIYGSRLFKSSPILLLALMGILVSSMFGSLTALLKTIADPFDTLPAITFWLMGGLSGITWRNLPVLIITTLLGSAFLFSLRWRLNILSMGDEEAASLGVDTKRLKFMIILCATIMMASAVSVSGVIGWVGLVTPHIGRILVGSDHKQLVPISLILGASYLLIIDSLARTIFPGEIPLGILTGLIGVPFFILMLGRSQLRW